MKRVAVTGASGFVGRALVRELVARNYRVIALGRHVDAEQFSDEVEVRRFDPSEGAANPNAFEGADAVVHLAGETVAGRWTAEKKRRISASRIDGTRAVVRSLAAMERRPSVLVSASASGYYGSRGDEPLFESSDAGVDFLAEVCAGWEHEAAKAEALGVRVVSLRTGLVLGDGGGALEKMLPPFRWGAGGPFGGGRQFVPWIHLADLVSLYILAAERRDLRGPINAIAPDYATSARFAQALGAALGRPALIPAPAAALHLLLGEFATTLFASQLMLPAVASDAGFAWRHPTLEAAMIDIVSRPPRRPATRHFAAETLVNASLEEVFAFFSDARNLPRITPPAMHFRMESEPLRMDRGTLIDYRLRIRGVPIRWRTLIAEWNPPHEFTDVQLHGPYALWKHHHRFEAVPGGVRISDDVDYVLPYAPFGNAAAKIVDTDVHNIFTHRATIIKSQFPSPRIDAERSGAGG